MKKKGPDKTATPFPDPRNQRITTKNPEILNLVIID